MSTCFSRCPIVGLWLTLIDPYCLWSRAVHVSAAALRTAGVLLSEHTCCKGSWSCIQAFVHVFCDWRVDWRQFHCQLLCTFFKVCNVCWIAFSWWFFTWPLWLCRPRLRRRWLETLSSATATKSFSFWRCLFADALVVRFTIKWFVPRIRFLFTSVTSFPTVFGRRFSFSTFLGPLLEAGKHWASCTWCGATGSFLLVARWAIVRCVSTANLFQSCESLCKKVVFRPPFAAFSSIECVCSGDKTCHFLLPCRHLRETIRWTTTSVLVCRVGVVCIQNLITGGECDDVVWKSF